MTNINQLAVVSRSTTYESLAYDPVAIMSINRVDSVETFAYPYYSLPNKNPLLQHGHRTPVGDHTTASCASSGEFARPLNLWAAFALPLSPPGEVICRGLRCVPLTPEPSHPAESDAGDRFHLDAHVVPLLGRDR